MSDAIYKNTINTFELIRLLALDHQSDFELLKRMLFSNLNVITRVPNTRDQFTLTYQTTENGMYLEEQLTTRYDSNVISIVRSGVDEFQVTSTRPWQSPPVIFTRIYDNSPFVEVAIWKKAILLLSIREMELTCQFNNIDAVGRPIWAKLTAVHLRTGLVFELGDAVLKNRDLYKYLARSLPDGRLVLNSDTSPISMNVSKAHAKLWFECISEWSQILTDFSNCKAWMPPKETDNG
jgi:hypothetical protein